MAADGEHFAGIGLFEGQPRRHGLLNSCNANSPAVHYAVGGPRRPLLSGFNSNFASSSGGITMNARRLMWSLTFADVFAAFSCAIALAGAYTWTVHQLFINA